MVSTISGRRVTTPTMRAKASLLTEVSL
jgi:hypothetical protein